MTEIRCISCNTLITEHMARLQIRQVTDEFASCTTLCSVCCTITLGSLTTEMPAVAEYVTDIVNKLVKIKTELYKDKHG